MEVSQAVKAFLDYQRMNSKKKYAEELPAHTQEVLQLFQ